LTSARRTLRRMPSKDVRRRAEQDGGVRSATAWLHFPTLRRALAGYRTDEIVLATCAGQVVCAGRIGMMWVVHTRINVLFFRFSEQACEVGSTPIATLKTAGVTAPGTKWRSPASPYRSRCCRTGPAHITSDARSNPAVRARGRSPARHRPRAPTPDRRTCSNLRRQRTPFRHPR
jgi:hypothetical protein